MDLNIAQKRRAVVTSSVTSTKGNRKRKRVYQPRRTRKFQLRDNNPQDMHVREILDYAKSQRREVTMIRNAVQLQHSLEQGDISVLLERFPWVVEVLKSTAPSGGGELLEIKSMLEMVMAQQKTTLRMESVNTLASTQQPSTGKLIGGGVSLALPRFDDDDLPTVAIAKNKDTNAAKNFVAAMMKLY